MNVIEIFKTNIQGPNEAEEVLHALQGILPGARINFVADDIDKIIRVEHPAIDPAAVLSVVEKLGFSCKLIPDKICNSPEDMRNFWDTAFTGHQTMWGFEPAQSAIIAKDLFIEKGIKDVLIPGIGYGRNARPFIENGIKVTGIEISQKAIELARELHGAGMQIFHGSVTDMPFDAHLYEGIFCYGLVYLLNPEQRKKMIRDCFRQLQPGGWMIFSVVSKTSPNYGKGKEVAKDTFEVGKGGQVFFYDTGAVELEFGPYGLVDYFEVEELPSFRFMVVRCKKDF